MKHGQVIGPLQGGGGLFLIYKVGTYLAGHSIVLRIQRDGPCMVSIAPREVAAHWLCSLCSEMVALSPL